jgi:hypothetical protein
VKQLQGRTEPPPCLTVAIVHFGSNSSRGVLQTINFPSESKRLNFDSSDQTKFFKKSTGFSSISLANLSHFPRLILFTYGFLRAHRPNNLTSCACFRIVSACNEIPIFFSIPTFTVKADFRQSSLSLRWISRSVVAADFLLRPRPNKLPIHVVALYLGHTKNSGAGTIILYRELEKIFFLYILIAQALLYKSTLFHHCSVDIIILRTQQK